MLKEKFEIMQSKQIVIFSSFILSKRFLENLLRIYYCVKCKLPQIDFHYYLQKLINNLLIFKHNCKSCLLK